METVNYGQNPIAPNPIGGQRASAIDRMGALERARAVEGMHQAMALGELSLLAMKRVRRALKTVGEVVGHAVGGSIR